MSTGYLSVVTRLYDESVPISGARVYVAASLPLSSQGEASSKVSDSYYNFLLTTDSSGNTGFIRIVSPDSELSQNPENTSTPYSLVDVYVEKDGFFPLRIENVQVFANTQSILPVNMVPLAKGYTDASAGVITYTIPQSNLMMPASPVSLGPSNEQTQALISQEVYIPETITVHLGTPSSDAENVVVPFPDYIKNVACSEIYPTWPEEALKANIIAIVSIALNRFFTEWYPSQGYDFDITSSTGFDQSFVKGRNIFENISRLVDELFNIYVSKDGYKNPLFTTFCDGKKVSCDGLSQWGTVSLANNGSNALEILKYYYGDDIILNSAENVEGAIESYPGFPLSLGSEGDAVLVIQQQLMRIRNNYPALPLIPTIDGIFGTSTDSAVRTFQEIFDLSVDGVVGKSTWYKISYIYTSVAKLAELTGEGVSDIFSGEIPNVTLSFGDSNDFVILLQAILNYIGVFYPSIPPVTPDGIFGTSTKNAVNAFEQTFGLEVTGTVTPAVWRALYEVYTDIIFTVTPSLPNQGYPGYDLKRGDTGEKVRLMQKYLNAASKKYPSIPAVSQDGVFGADTERAVLAFQKATGLNETGIINVSTWERIAEIYNFQSLR